MDITPIVSAGIALIGAIITTFVVPYIKTKKSAAEIEKLEHIASTAVHAAQQIFDKEQKEEKKQYALAYLEKKGYKLNIDAASAIIEAEVHKMKMELKKGA